MNSCEPLFRSEKKSGIVSRCLQRLINEHILKFSGKVRGHFLSEPRRAVNALAYMERCWRIYQKVCTPRKSSPWENSFCMRQFLFLLKVGRISIPRCNVWGDGVMDRASAFQTESFRGFWVHTPSKVRLKTLAITAFFPAFHIKWTCEGICGIFVFVNYLGVAMSLHKTNAICCGSNAKP